MCVEVRHASMGVGANAQRKLEFIWRCPSLHNLHHPGCSTEKDLLISIAARDIGRRGLVRSQCSGLPVRAGRVPSPVHHCGRLSNPLLTSHRTCSMRCANHSWTRVASTATTTVQHRQNTPQVGAPVVIVPHHHTPQVRKRARQHLLQHKPSSAHSEVVVLRRHEPERS